MLTSEELVAAAVQSHTPAQLQGLERQQHDRAVYKIQCAIHDMWWNRTVKITGIVVLTILIAAVAVSIVIAQAEIIAYTGIAEFFLLLGGAIIYDDFALPRSKKRAYQQVAAVEPTTRLTTELVAPETIGDHHLQTVLIVEDQSTVLEQIPVDLDSENSVALAARMQARNEQVLSQLHQWRADPAAFVASGQFISSTAREHAATITDVLSTRTNRASLSA